MYSMFSITEANALAADPDLDTGIFIRSDPLKTKAPPIIPYFFGRRAVCTQTALFFIKPVSKNCGNFTFFVWRAVWCLPNGHEIRVVQRFGWFFSSNKSVPANRKKGFFGSRLPKNEEIKGTVPLTNHVCLCPHTIYVYSALSPIYPSFPVSFNFNFILILTYPSVLAWTWSILFARSLGRLEWNQGWDLCMVAWVSVSLSPTGAATRRLTSTTK